MTPTPEESDALVIARWCWPERSWVQDSDLDYVEAPDAEPVSLKDGGCAMVSHAFLARDAGSVHAAERLLIERGLAEEYGIALRNATALRLRPMGLQTHSTPTVLGLFEAIAIAATAPLEARVRALASVVRAQTELSR